MATTLGSGYKLMNHVFDPGKNAARPITSYGCTHKESVPVSGIQGHYTQDMRFEMIVCKVYADRLSDAVAQTTINELHEKVDACFRALAFTKIGLPLIVLNTFDLSISEPEILENGAALLRAQFTVKYRQAIT